jgi:hypothetical protein
MSEEKIPVPHPGEILLEDYLIPMEHDLRRAQQQFADTIEREVLPLHAEQRILRARGR